LATIPWDELEWQIDAQTERNEKAKPTRIVKALRQEQQRDENRKVVEAVTPLTDSPGTFSTIVIDPPWDWNDDGDVSQFGRGRQGSGLPRHVPSVRVTSSRA